VGDACYLTQFISSDVHCLSAHYEKHSQLEASTKAPVSVSAGPHHQLKDRLFDGITSDPMTRHLIVQVSHHTNVSLA
jgi:hypothetical protein